MGGSSGGGGGGSGQVSYPSYMEGQHQTWLSQVSSDIQTARTGNSPFYSLIAYDPDTALSNMDTAVCAFATVVTALDNENDWTSAMTAAQTKIDALIDDTYINADIAAFADVMDDQVDNVVIPKFQRGMQDINAVQTSGYLLGEALIYGMRDRDVAKYGTELRMKLNHQRNDMILRGSETMVQSLLTEVQYQQGVAHYQLEYNRMTIAAKKEETDTNILLDEMDARWDLETFQYGANMLAGIGGGVGRVTGSRSQGSGTSALGGAVSGAAVGAQVSGGNVYAIAVGAIIGGIVGALS